MKDLLEIFTGQTEVDPAKYIREGASVPDWVNATPRRASIHPRRYAYYRDGVPAASGMSADHLQPYKGFLSQDVVTEVMGLPAGLSATPPMPYSAGIADIYALRIATEAVVDEAVTRLENEVRQLRQSNERLIGHVGFRIEALERAVFEDGSKGSITEYSMLATADKDGLAEIAGESPAGLSGLLEAAANNEIVSEAISALAQESLENNDPNVRAAAARALSTSAPEQARRVIPELAAKEQNRITAQIMRAALRALA